MESHINEHIITKAAKTGLELVVAIWIVRRSTERDNGIESSFKDLIKGRFRSESFGDLSPTYDGVEFYEVYQSDIWELAMEQARLNGSGSVFLHLAGCEADNKVANYDAMANFLARYAFQVAARMLADRLGIDA